MPLQRAAALQQRRPFVHRLDEPLTRRDNFERAITLFKKLDVVGDGPGITDQIAGLPQQFNDAGTGFDGGQPGELIVGGLRASRV